MDKYNKLYPAKSHKLIGLWTNIKITFSQKNSQKKSGFGQVYFYWPPKMAATTRIESKKYNYLTCTNLINEKLFVLKPKFRYGV